MFNLNDKQNRPIQIVLSLDDLEEVIRTVLSEVSIENNRENKENIIFLLILNECHRLDSKVEITKDKRRKPSAICKMRLVLAAISFLCGITITLTNIFIVPPIGEIFNSAMSVVCELLIICGAILDAKARN